MWWMMCAMIRCQEYLDTLPNHHMIMQIHDELVFDFPAGRGAEPWKTNIGKARRLKMLMEEGGDNIGVPTPVSFKYHPHTWSKGISV